MLTVDLDPDWRYMARPAEDAGAFARRTVAAAAKAAGVPAASVQVKRRPAKRRREPLDQGQVIGQLITALSAKAGGDLDPLVALHQLSRQLDDAMTAATIEARRAGHSWSTIAGELGMSRQAAHKRWAAAVAAAGVEPAEAEAEA